MPTLKNRSDYVVEGFLIQIPSLGWLDGTMVEQAISTRLPQVQIPPFLVLRDLAIMHDKK